MGCSSLVGGQAKNRWFPGWWFGVLDVFGGGLRVMRPSKTMRGADFAAGLCCVHVRMRGAGGGVPMKERPVLGGKVGRKIGW